MEIEKTQMSLNEILENYIYEFNCADRLNNCKLDEESTFDEEEDEILDEKIHECLDKYINKLDSLNIENLNSKIEKIFKEKREQGDNSTSKAEDKLLDILYNRITKIETFVGISSDSDDIRFRNIIRDYEDGVIRMPKFQRKYIWDKKRAAELIASLIYGIPIPPIYSYETNDEVGIRNIIDGQQRLTSLLFFYYKAFPKSMTKRKSYNKFVFKLLKRRKNLIEKLSIDEDLTSSEKKEMNLKIKEVENDLKKIGIELDVEFPIRTADGKVYDLSKVSEQTMSTILTRNISIITIKSANKAAMAHIFNVYNTSSVKLTENEIRKAIYADNELYKNIIYISDPETYKDSLEEDKLEYTYFQECKKILSKIIGSKDIENSLFKMLSFNFNLKFKYLIEKGIYEETNDKIKKALNSCEENVELVDILNNEINYAKGKIYSIIDEYANYVSLNKKFVSKEIVKLKNFINLIKMSPELENRSQYNIKNITCVYILLDYFKILDVPNLDYILKEKYFECDKSFTYKTLELERFKYIYNLIKTEGDIKIEH